MPHLIHLDVLDIECPDAKWDNLIRQYAIEDHNDGEFIISAFPELSARPRVHKSPAMEDALGVITHKSLKSFGEELWKKYRIGEEFKDDADHDLIWNKIYATAKSAASADRSGFIGVEIYYWVVLQLVREARGEYIDKVYQGASTRLGQYGGLRDLPDTIML